LDAGIQSDRSDVDERWAKALGEEVRSAELELTAIFAKTHLHLSDVVRMKKGDIIPIELPEFATILSQEIPLFKASLGTHADQYALKVEHKFQRPEHITMGIEQLEKKIN